MVTKRKPTKKVAAAGEVCPNCGHCPTCGRSNALPYYPWGTWPYGWTYTIQRPVVNPYPNWYTTVQFGNNAAAGNATFSVPLSTTGAAPTTLLTS